MKSAQLVARLDRDFIRPQFNDDWAQYMTEIEGYLTPGFKKTSMGLVFDFAKEIKHVYTSVFPSNEVMKDILRRGGRDAMLFLHHAAIWDIRKAPNVFYQMDPALVQQFKERNISIYVLHVPLDDFGPYSTSVTLANTLGLKNHKPFGKYCGSLCGVFGSGKHSTVAQVAAALRDAVGHKVKIYKYGSTTLTNGTVAVVGGGGNSIDLLEDLVQHGVNTLVTGITAISSHSAKAHAYAKEHKLNLIGATHYSTEQFACQKMCTYFRKLGLKSTFIKDKPVLQDM